MSEIKAATTQSELIAIERIAKEIWEAHYTPIIGKNQVAYMLDKFQSLAAMNDQIQEGFYYYSLEEKDKIIGYLAFQQRNSLLFLSKIYIHPSQQGKGYGRLLLDFIKKEAQTMSLSTIQLTVNKYNSRTIEVYKRYGFELIKEAVFDIGKGYIMDDYVLELKV